MQQSHSAAGAQQQVLAAAALLCVDKVISSVHATGWAARQKTYFLLHKRAFGGVFSPPARSTTHSMMPLQWVIHR